MNNPLHDRVTSGFTLSVPTGLAMESLFAPRQAVYDQERIVPSKADLSMYSRLYVNVLTLVRNCYESVEKAAIPKLLPSHMAEVIEQEIGVIESLCSVEGRGAIAPIFYLNDHSGLTPKNSKIFTRREDKTPLQRQARFIFDKSISLILKNVPQIEMFYSDINGQGTNALIFTHIPADLLSERRFGRLDLIESYTGALKARYSWGSKYYPVPDYDMESLPFCRQLLCAFGDKVILAPLPIKARREIVEVAKAARWNPSTSPSRVSTDLLRLKDPVLFGALNAISIH